MTDQKQIEILTWRYNRLVDQLASLPDRAPERAQIEADLAQVARQIDRILYG